jgi:Tol biopolymer transport system component
LSESWNQPIGWTSDSKTIIFASNREGSWGIYKQTLQDNTAVPIRTGLRDLPSNSAVTPDGTWVLYAVAEPVRNDSSFSRKLMRVPVSGGHAEPVVTGGDVFGARCPRDPAAQCVMVGPGTNEKELVFFSLDATSGRGAELMRLNFPTVQGGWDWQLSPDGARVALFEKPGGLIHLLTLKRHEIHEIHVKNSRSLDNLTWAADGKSLLISNPTPQGSALLQIDFRGNIHKVWEQKGDLATMGIPSPDRRHLAIMSWTVESNLWMLEDF